MTEAIQSKDDKNLSFTIMVDPPGADWEDTTEVSSPRSLVHSCC